MLRSLTPYQQLMLNRLVGEVEWLYSVERNVKDQGVKQACCLIVGMEMMFNEHWSGSVNYLCMVKK